jgi:DUF4097 and DUF4098 domain-containing protein YvlB
LLRSIAIAMKTLLAIAFIASAFAASATEEENLSRTFTVQPGGELVVDVDFGSIEVSSHPTADVSIEVHRLIGLKSSAKEKEFLQDNPVVFFQNGGTVTIKQRGKRQNGVWNWLGSRRMEAKYTIHVPAIYSARLNTSGGSIQAQDLQGEVKADTSGGSLKFAHITGPLHGSTSGGGIQASDCRGDSTLDTSGGGIVVTGGGGKLHVDTSGGTVSIKNYAGPANASTSGGDMILENIDGTVKASTSGGSISAVLLSPIPGDVDLDTTGGDVNVKVPEQASFNLDASTTGGSVTSDLPVQFTGKRQHEELRGPVNGGGKQVKLRTSGGSIHVRKSGPIG